MVKNALNQSTAAGAATKVNDKMRPNKERKKKAKKWSHVPVESSNLENIIFLCGNVI